MVLGDLTLHSLLSGVAFDSFDGSSRRGAAAGPSGMTTDLLRPLLSNPQDFHRLFRAAEQLARSQAPEVAVDAVCLGSMTALQKPNRGVRGIVAGDVLRRLVSRTIAQQIMPAVERFTSPFQYALRTRAGTECVAHVLLQALTESDPHTTVLSIDGISAFDMISRRAMLEALQQLPGGEQVLPFVRLFYGRQTTYLWDDDLGVVHQIPQAEGGEQGNPLMPLLFALGIHAALQAAQSNLPHEILMAFLDDMYITSSPLRVGHSFAVLQEQLRHANIRVHLGKIKVWNSSGVRPRACDTLQDIGNSIRQPRPSVEGFRFSPQINKAPKFWALRWDTEIRLCWSASQLFRTCRAHGHCSFTALPAERITSCAL